MNVFPCRAIKIALAAMLLVTTACVPVVPLVIGTATVTAVDISQDRRTPGKYVDDNVLEVKLRKAIRADETLTGVNISVTVFNGIVLLTGEVNSEAQRQRAAELSEAHRQTGEVAKVVNELTLAGKTNLSSRVNDAWLTTKVRARFIKARVPFSVAKVVTEHGKVYLLGRVTRAEADMMVGAIRDISGVTHIIKVFDYLDE